MTAGHRWRAVSHRGVEGLLVGDLNDDARRTEGVDAAQAAKLGDQLAPRRGSRAVGPPPGVTSVATSNWPSDVFSREARRGSHASPNSLPAPRTRPRIDATLSTGTRESLARRSGHVCIPVGPAGRAAVPAGSCSAS
jgi:hypothetical protein